MSEFNCVTNRRLHLLEFMDPNIHINYNSFDLAVSLKISVNITEISVKYHEISVKFTDVTEISLKCLG